MIASSVFSVTNANEKDAGELRVLCYLRQRPSPKAARYFTLLQLKAFILSPFLCVVICVLNASGHLLLKTFQRSLFLRVHWQVLSLPEYFDGTATGPVYPVVATTTTTRTTRETSPWKKLYSECDHHQTLEPRNILALSVNLHFWCLRVVAGPYCGCHWLCFTS